MQEKSASHILRKTMKWSKKDVTKHLADLQALSSYGYDEYQQFRPGMRFIESLASWLNQFPQERRVAAFGFVKDRILYITQDQMRQIISVAYGEYVIPILLKQASCRSSFHYWNVVRLRGSSEFKTLLHKCLFMGLSDGSQIDMFRRSSQEISHEQVYRTHEISNKRKDKIVQKLKKRLPEGSELRFCNVFLLDDFSASGITYLKENESSPHGMSGKIADFYCSITDKADPFSELVDAKNLRVWLILYVGTEHVKTRLQELGSKLFSRIQFTVIVIHTIPESVKYRPEENKEFTELIKIKKFGWEGLPDEHMSMGGDTEPYLGFSAGALPLILNHNTPNNSLPILHRDDVNVEFKGLFPRISRHR